jgi:transcriptional regulator with XRE-family HTH domain
MKHISPEQCRAARALLDLKQSELAEASGITEKTVVDFERGQRESKGQTLLKLHAAFGERGVKFIELDGLAGCIGPIAKPKPPKPKGGRPKKTKPITS